MGKENKHTNSLIHETSPYLLQHAHNPVDWYPWGEEALHKSKKEDKPIFLSIGYSSCHWCHVMEKESFENKEIASILNKHFISIKVDREERPDLDEIYMNAVQMLTGSGGWPMSVFLTPELKPFYGGTYFPPESNYGRVGFRNLILSIAEAWKENRNEIINNSKQFVDRINQYSAKISDLEGKLSKDILEKGIANLKSVYDPLYGGFGAAPKFPQGMALEFLMRMYVHTKDEKILTIVSHTLDKMASGGMYDHLGGGFHRYSTDRKWLVPHFEKMLYDNALLADLYLKAFQLTKKPLYKKTASEILDYVLREMTDSSGGFHSSQDADTKGEEGKFYTWTYREIIDALGKKDGDLICEYYSIQRENKENILHKSSDQFTAGFKPELNDKNSDERIDTLREKLYTIRLKRHTLNKDDKIITAWNALMISSFANAFQVLGDSRYLSAAEKAARFILSGMYDNGNLLRIYRKGIAKQPAFLNDYSFFISSLIDLYETTFDINWLIEAEKLTERMIEKFRDESGGGFFFTSASHKNLISRTKPVYDGSIPSGNATAAHALLRLSKLLDNKGYFTKAEKILNIFSEEIGSVPRGYMAMLNAADFYYNPPKEIAFVGDKNSSDLKNFLNALHSEYIPNKVVAFVNNIDGTNLFIENKIPLLRNKRAVDGKTTVYVCKNFTCQRPVTDPESFMKIVVSDSEG
ncbi:thioredoxin domain-containing protein [Fibrobacterota bacterium]